MVGHIACLLIGPERNADRQSLRIRAFFLWNSDARENVKLLDMNFVLQEVRLIRHARILATNPFWPIAANILCGEGHSRESRASGKFALNENGVARICVSKAVSVVGRGDPHVRDLRHLDGDRVSECDQMDH